MSPATIGRRLHEIRGSRRSGKNGWTPPGARAPVAAIAQPVAETKRLVSLLSEGAPESEPDFIASLFSAQAEALDDPTVEAERQRLSAALSDAESHDEMSAIELEIAMLDPVVAHYLAAGDSRVLALSIAGHSPLILSRPEDLAELASLVTYGPELEQEEGESDEDFARCIGARRLRAIELLTQALTIIVTSKEESRPATDTTHPRCSTSSAAPRRPCRRRRPPSTSRELARSAAATSPRSWGRAGHGRSSCAPRACSSGPTITGCP
ncbi:MAG: hypothetical protein IPF92_19355 [Myxococcales bacterium]|nr:hypothetical protein [Myxococcales bacterium]